MVLLQLKDTLELFVKRREFLTGSGFLSRHDMTLVVESDVKLHSFLPSFSLLLSIRISTPRFQIFPFHKLPLDPA